MQNIFLSARQKAVSLYIQNTWGFSWEGVAAGWPRDSRRDSVSHVLRYDDTSPGPDDNMRLMILMLFNCIHDFTVKCQWLGFAVVETIDAWQPRVTRLLFQQVQ